MLVKLQEFRIARSSISIARSSITHYSTATTRKRVASTTVVPSTSQLANVNAKTWWVEAEAIVSALYMHRLTGDAKYLAVFEKSYGFIDKYQTDWESGEWDATITPEGKALGATKRRSGKRATTTVAP